MLASPPMRLRSLAACALFGSALAFAACGDGPDDPATATPTTAGSTVTQPPSSATAPPTIEAPTIPEGNVEAIRPEHGAKLTQAETRNPNPDDPAHGVCIQVNFDGLPEQFQWLRMVIDEQEVTVSPDIILLAPSSAQQQTPEGGTMCYVPPEGLGVGIHTVVVAIQNPRNPQEPTRQLIEWQFEVLP